ncbi:hypothetical protein J2W97_001345 [Paenibacillus jamilae]|nr:hypothetical protein [Paenibacillus jamilae]
MEKIDIKIENNKLFIKADKEMCSLKYGYREYSNKDYVIKIETQYKEHEVEDLKKIYEIQVENYIGKKMRSSGDDHPLNAVTILKLENHLIQLLSEEIFNAYKKETINYFLEYQSCNKLLEINDEEMKEFKSNCKTIETIVEKLKTGNLNSQLNSIYGMSISSRIDKFEEILNDMYQVVKRYDTFISLSKDFEGIVKQDYNYILL